eukprot:gb/GECH01002056.1/.p1 GENE.gb/GECH01002056.1/~~gb/GECH01002056.1/.p1  ORF type:complete len:460 (+),score=91.20 gb/GECH01002056.1/:1-1380(+)
MPNHTQQDDRNNQNNSYSEYSNNRKQPNNFINYYNHSHRYRPYHHNSNNQHFHYSNEFYHDYNSRNDRLNYRYNYDHEYEYYNDPYYSNSYYHHHFPSSSSRHERRSSSNSKNSKRSKYSRKRSNDEIYDDLSSKRDRTYTNSKKQRIEEPTPKSNRQLKVFWNDFKWLRSRLLKHINRAQLRDCPNAQRDFEDYAYELLVEKRLNDDKAYNALFKLVHKKIKPSQEYLTHHPQDIVNNVFRSNNRVIQIKRILDHHEFKNLPKLGNYIDVGCSEGAITAALGSALEYDHNTQVFGCDVVPVSSSEGFQFSLLRPDDQGDFSLPYETNSASLITCLMSLHHMTKPHQMLQEVLRVLNPKGVLLIREHDCDEYGLSLMLDILHGFYAMVWHDPREMDDFREHFAHYRSRQTWNDIITSIGFQIQRTDEAIPLGIDPERLRRKPKDPEKNPFRYYYEVFTP